LGSFFDRFLPPFLGRFLRVLFGSFLEVFSGAFSGAKVVKTLPDVPDPPPIEADVQAARSHQPVRAPGRRTAIFGGFYPLSASPSANPVIFTPYFVLGLNRPFLGVCSWAK
jgi:hypothetical protein